MKNGEPRINEYRCKGSWRFGNNCGTCHHCQSTARQMVVNEIALQSAIRGLLAMIEDGGTMEQIQAALSLARAALARSEGR